MFDLQWQTSIDPVLIQRLLRTAQRPGVVDLSMPQKIAVRTQQLGDRLSLLNTFKRHSTIEQSNTVPIVYAQPSRSEAVDRPVSESRSIAEIVKPQIRTTANSSKVEMTKPHIGTANSSKAATPVVRSIPASSAGSTVIQAKFETGATSSSMLDRTSTIDQFTPERSSVMLPDQAPPTIVDRLIVPENVDRLIVPEKVQQFEEHQSLSIAPVVSPEKVQLFKADQAPMTIPPPVVFAKQLQPEFKDRPSPLVVAPFARSIDSSVPLVHPMPRETISTSNSIESLKSSTLSTRQTIEHRTIEPTQSRTTISLSYPQGVAPTPEAPQIDLDDLTRQIERKLARRMVIEQERRGRMPWS
ncbi:hypothetical protein ACQ4M3_03760 [Leptolyngbya sp. AN03gr2]|uniref:hypothetical protein n=1 Tax=unclassified Leptolyngbya TaxID=2650499 RepID=UPI003D321274